MTQKPFNPLESSITPEQRGYGKRFIKISTDFTKLEILKHGANGKDLQSTSQINFK